MKTVRMTIVVLAGLIAFGFWLPEADAYNDDFEDGGTHIIDCDAGNSVTVRDGPSGETTTVIVTSGGQIWWSFALFESSKAYITGGLIGGAGQGWLIADQTSSFIISGGEIKRDFLARYSSKSTISGGLFGGEISAGYYDSGGGYTDNAEITIIGRNFKVCGQRVEPGTYTVSNSPFGPGRLTGTLANGDPFDNIVRIYNNSSIVIVLQPAIPPVADAGSEQTVMDADDNGSEVVTLDGSGSSDSNGTIASWLWTDDLGDTIPDGEITTATLSVGIHTITLTVTDDDGLTNTDTVTVTIEPFPNQPPVANAGSGQTVMDADDNGSEQVTLDGSGSADSDGTIQSYVWSKGGTQIATGLNPNITLSIGQHTIALTVTDDDGATDTDTVTITIEPYPNQPPVAYAGGPYTIHIGDTLTLNASGSTDDNNNIVSYIWDMDDNNSFETDAGSQAVFDVNYACLQSLGLLVNNTYNIHLKVTDSEGLSNVNDTTLTIIPEPATLLLHAPNGGESFMSGECSTFTGNDIFWSSNGVISEVIIEYSTDNGQHWNTVSPPNTGNTGSYAWGSIPLVASNECLIRISDAADSSVSDISDNLFEIEEPMLSLIQPNGGERILKGSYYNVLWNSNLPEGSVFIEYSTDNGESWQPVATTEDTGSYNWHITGPESGDYLIQTSDTNGYGGYDWSCNSFAVYSCLEQIAGDLNGDCVVDFEDFAIMATHWLQRNYVMIANIALDTNPGWTTQGQWQFGTPKGMGGLSYGYPDPDAAYTGQNVYGVNLNGDYTVAVGGPYRLTAGPFDCNSYETVELSFARWLNTDTADYVQCKVEASNNGSTWQTVWVNPTTVPITDNQWQVVDYDISQMAAGYSQVYIRWSYQVLDDRAFRYSGWNIDDVELLGLN